MEALQILRQHIPLSAEEWAKTAPLFQPLHLHKGETWVKQGQLALAWAIVEEGILRTYRLIDGKPEFTVCFCEEGRCTTSIESYMLEIPSNCTITAATDVKLRVIQKEAWQHLVIQEPVWAQLERKLLAGELMELEQHTTQLVLEDATARYLKLKEKQPLVIARLT